MPAGKAELDEAANVVRLPYTEAFIKEAPSISADAEISEAEEDNIYRYYGIDDGGAGMTATETGAASTTVGAGYAGTGVSGIPEAAGASALANASGTDDGASRYAAPVSESAGTEDLSGTSRWRRTSRPDDSASSSARQHDERYWRGCLHAFGAGRSFTVRFLGNACADDRRVAGLLRHRESLWFHGDGFVRVRGCPGRAN